MPHPRPRHALSVIERSLKFWPVVCLVGSRQVGKSTLLRSLRRLKYLTLDDPGLAALAAKDPTQLLEPPCVIDEAQKAPGVFDAVKLDVDRSRRPGRYVLTGSVRFSQRTLIRESLTGRAKTLQLFPLTCAEALSMEFEDRWNRAPRTPRVRRSDFQRHLSRGGMPAIFAARSADETTSYWNALIESYVYRDLHLAVPVNPRPAVALAILKAIAETLALGERPTFARIHRKAGGTRALVERHLTGLEDMMILHRVGHVDASRTKDILMPFDTAFFLTLLGLSSPTHDAAVHGACLHIALLNEALAQGQAAGRPAPIQYAISPKGELIHLVMPRGPMKRPLFWQISQEAVPHDYSVRFLRTAVAKSGGGGVVLSSIRKSYRANGFMVHPWECVL